ncbi:hypothetical protein AB4144_01915 [Rhizobiaceae sp. 2RAB30]
MGAASLVVATFAAASTVPAIGGPIKLPTVQIAYPSDITDVNWHGGGFHGGWHGGGWRGGGWRGAGWHGGGWHGGGWHGGGYYGGWYPAYGGYYGGDRKRLGPQRALLPSQVLLIRAPRQSHTRAIENPQRIA